MVTTHYETVPAHEEPPARPEIPASALEENDSEGCHNAHVAILPTDNAEAESSLQEKSQTQREPLGAWITQHKKTIATILGLYLLALSCSIGHYSFFRQLDGSIASGDRARISQSYTTVISLLLVTLFKASLLGSVSVCSAQYLWFVLRGRPIALAKVESLFQIRHNPLELANPRVILSVSFLLAAYTWLVPFAAIYPPGALTVASSPFSRGLGVPLSVPEVSFTSDFDLMSPQNVSRFSDFQILHQYPDYDPSHKELPERINISTRIGPVGPLEFLRQFFKLVVTTGEILQLPMPPGENSTYTLSFLGPQLSCHRVNHFNHTEVRNTSDYKQTIFDDLIVGEDRLSKGLTFERAGIAWPIIQQKVLATTNCSQDREDKLRQYNQGSRVEEYVIETMTTNCTEIYVSYAANITYVKGVRSIVYKASPLEPQPKMERYMYTTWETTSKDAKFDFDGYWWGNGGPAAFKASPSYQDMKQQSKRFFRYWNAFFIYASFVESITSVTRRICSPLTGNDCIPQYLLPNGSITNVSSADCSRYGGGSTTLLQDSRLNPYRFAPYEEYRASQTSDVNVTEATLNEQLTNITFSLASLNLFTDNNVTVNTTEYLNTYDFSRPPNLILPYALCLAAGLIIVALGLWSMWQNGVPASDGFMQVMMATRGRTQMERLVIEQGGELGDVDEASRVLKELKIRYGELVMEDELGGKRSWGFGTADETMSLRKRR